MKYLDDTLRCPPKPAANSSVSVVTLYTHWYRHDRLLLNAIFASVSKAVMPLIGMTTTSRARIMQLKEDLTLIQQGSHTVFEFHHAIKVIADELSLIDAPISNDDLMLYVLNGLSSEFRDMVAPIRTREIALSFAELHDLLIGHEHYLKAWMEILRPWLSLSIAPNGSRRVIGSKITRTVPNKIPPTKLLQRSPFVCQIMITPVTLQRIMPNYNLDLLPIALLLRLHQMENGFLILLLLIILRLI